MKTMLSVVIAATSFGAIADGGVGQNGIVSPCQATRLFLKKAALKSR